MKWYLKALSNYVTFTGRARRSEFWYFNLFNTLFIALAMILDNSLGINFNIQEVEAPYGYIYLLYVLGTFLPALAVSVRRLHDVGKSGWMYLIILIPLIGAIWLLVLFFSDSQSGNNKWGDNPKQLEN